MNTFGEQITRPAPVGWAIPSAIFVGATVLAALMSPSVSLWTDESVTISAAERTLGELWALVQRIDAVHALYYAFMSVWVDVFGASPFSLRLPSALAAGGTALGVYFLTTRLASPRTALVAAVVSATLPRLVWSGIEARPFVFSALLAVWATYALVRAMSRRSVGSWVLYAALAAIGVMINIYLVMVVVGHAITVIARARKERRVLAGFGISAVAVAIASTPLLLLVRSQQAQLGGNGDRNVLSIARKVVINQFFLGETPDPDAGAAWFTLAWQAAAILAAALGIAAMVLAIVRPSAPGDRKADVLAVTLPWIILPTALVAGYAVAVAPIYQPRYFTFTAPAAAILIALGLRTLSRRWYTITAIALYAVCIAVVFVSQRTPFAKSGSDWSAVASAISEAQQPRDAVYFAPRYEPVDGIIDQTTRRIAQAYPAGFAGLTDLTLEQTGAETARLDGFSRPIGEAERDLADVERVWGVYNLKSGESVVSEGDEFFERLGFRAKTIWDGPSTLVIEYLRTP